MSEDAFEEESFADLLNAYEAGSEGALQIGEKIRGKIISIGKDAVFVDTHTKIDGVVDKAELADEDQKLPYKEGDILELYVVGVSESEIRLSRAISGVGGLNLLKDAHQKAVPVEGKIKATCKGGFEVEVMQRRAFCPISQIDIKHVDNPEGYVGETAQFLITRLEERGRNIVLSRRQLLNREQEKNRKDFLDQLQVDSTLDGSVTKVMPFGVFVELAPGVEGMIHISELSWSRVGSPQQSVAAGDRVRVKVIGVDSGDRSSKVKISLSLKQLGDDPWNTVADRFAEGDRVEGVVTRCTKFGAFVEIAPGIEGLVHISEMSYLKRVVSPEDIAVPGDTVAVVIKEINPQKRRLSLSIRDAEGDPWLNVPQMFTVGQIVQGVIEKKETFGYFVTLAPGITGLLPKSKIRQADKSAAIESLKEGREIAVVVEEILPQARKITLSPGNLQDEQDWQAYTRTSGGSLGSLGDKLQQALADKKKS
jgi:small subunit ribosomal protein S1